MTFYDIIYYLYLYLKLRDRFGNLLILAMYFSRYLRRDLYGEIRADKPTNTDSKYATN